ncbi:MAG: carbon-nitrogen hydrolase family protein [Acidobacteriota bacterium]
MSVIRMAVHLCVTGAAMICAATSGDLARHNLIPNPDFGVGGGTTPAGWKTWSPREGLAPDARVVNVGNGNALFLGARDASNFGKWITVVPDVEGEKTYNFEASYRPTNIDQEDVSVAAILSWCADSAGNRPIQRDYAARVPEAEGWSRVARTIKAPKGTQAVRVELVLRWSNQGSVLWKNVRMVEVDPTPRRIVRVATTRIAIPEPTSTPETNIKLIREILDKAGKQRPDIVLLSENVSDRWVELPLEKTAETIPGPLTAMLSEKARQYGMYVATSLHERAGATIYNTGILIGRRGEIVGKYRKVHLALEEGEMGVTPGGEYPVFETDFGKVGILICWDYWFSEPARLLRLNGAELLLLPIAGEGDRLHWDVISRARAIDNGVYFVTSSTVAESSSRIISPTGNVLAETNDEFGVAVGEIDLNREYRLLWLSVGAEGEAKSLYIKERQPHTYKGLVDANQALK